MRRSKPDFIPGYGRTGHDGYQGRVFERKPDGSIGPTVAGVEITFVSENGNMTRTVTSNDVGYYKITLTPQRYVVTAKHPHYYDYSSAPDFFVVTSGVYRIGDILMIRDRPVDLLMITTSLLATKPNFEDIVNQYKRVLVKTEGLHATYVELDSDECLDTYCTRVDNPGSWVNVRGVLEEIIRITGASYIMILGGPLVVPRPVTGVCCVGSDIVRVPGDAWYLDFDGDKIVDEELSIGRLPDLSYKSLAVVVALQTAIELHNAGGYTLDNEVRFTPNEGDYHTPPYGACNVCDEKDTFFTLMSTSDYICFAGHGTPDAIWSNDMVLKFSTHDIDSVDLQQYHPVIKAYGSCNAGCLYDSSPTLAYEFMNAGAAAYLGRTMTLGIPAYVDDNFPGAIEGGMRIGPALFQSMRQAVLEQGSTAKKGAGQICLYGDPTLKRR